MANEPLTFSILSMATFVKVLSTIKDIHDGDFTDFKMTVDPSQVKFASKKFKTKLQCCNEDII